MWLITVAVGTLAPEKSTKEFSALVIQLRPAGSSEDDASVLVTDSWRMLHPCQAVRRTQNRPYPRVGRA